MSRQNECEKIVFKKSKEAVATFKRRCHQPPNCKVQQKPLACISQKGDPHIADHIPFGPKIQKMSGIVSLYFYGGLEMPDVLKGTKILLLGEYHDNSHCHECHNTYCYSVDEYLEDLAEMATNHNRCIDFFEEHHLPTDTRTLLPTIPGKITNSIKGTKTPTNPIGNNFSHVQHLDTSKKFWSDKLRLSDNRIPGVRLHKFDIRGYLDTTLDTDSNVEYHHLYNKSGPQDPCSWLKLNFEIIDNNNVLTPPLYNILKSYLMGIIGRGHDFNFRRAIKNLLGYSSSDITLTTNNFVKKTKNKIDKALSKLNHKLFYRNGKMLSKSQAQDHLINCYYDNWFQSLIKDQDPVLTFKNEPIDKSRLPSLEQLKSKDLLLISDIAQKAYHESKDSSLGNENLKKYNNFKIYISLFITDIYLLAKMFSIFDPNKTNRGPIGCDSEYYNQPKNIVVYGGRWHIDNINMTIRQLFGLGIGKGELHSYAMDNNKMAPKHLKGKDTTAKKNPMKGMAHCIALAEDNSYSYLL